MPGDEHIDRLGAWTGDRAGSVQRFEAGVHGPEPEVWIELHPRPGRIKVCDGCGQPCRRVHDTTERRVRDLPVFDARTHLLVHRCRLACPRCGPRLERLDWLSRHARVTTRLGESLARLCGVLPIKHTAEHFGLGWDAVKAIHKAHLESTLGEPDLDGLEVLAMDEFALHKGHRYPTVVIDPTCKRVLWVGRGRNRESIRRPEDLVRLDELLRANKRLMTVYVLRDELKQMWRYRSRWHAERHWKQWYAHAVRSRIDPLKRFAKRLKAYLHGILSHCRSPLHTSLLEGINNKIKVIKRMACGDRDEAYFFLRIRDAFPGAHPGNPG